jgi:hypothetical protein
MVNGKNNYCQNGVEIAIEWKNKQIQTLKAQ